MLIPPGPSYSWRKAFTLIISTSLFTLSLFFLTRQSVEKPVAAIVQEPLGKALPTQAFAEFLNLSIDVPTPFGQFSPRWAKQTLMEKGIFEKVSIKKLRPDRLFIQYRLKVPVAKLGNAKNVAIDQAGKRFPLEPFFDESDLPTLFIEGENFAYFETCLHHPVENVDMLQIEARTLGKREIIVRMQNSTLLRLPVRGCARALEDYSLLATKMDLTDKIVDLRISDTAYIYE